MSLTVPTAEWLEGHAGKQGVTDSIPGGGTYDNFDFFFRLLSVDHSSTKTIQVKSSMTFIQSNGCIGIDLILNKYGSGLYDDMSALTIDNTEFDKHIPYIYPPESSLIKFIIRTRIPYLDLNMKVIDNNMLTSVYDKQNREST